MKESIQSRSWRTGSPVALVAATLAVTACVLDGPVSSQLESTCAGFRVVDLDSLAPDTVGIDDTLVLAIQTPQECVAAPATRYLWASSDESKATVTVPPATSDLSAIIRGVALEESAEFTNVTIWTRLIAPDIDTGYVVPHPITVVPKLLVSDLFLAGTNVVIDTSLDIGGAFDVTAEVHNSMGRLETANHRIELQLGFRTNDGTFIPVFDFGEDTTGNRSGTFVGGRITRFARNGRASFESLRILTPGIDYQLRASSGGLTKGFSGPFDVGFVRPEFAAQPTDADAGAFITPPVTVRVLNERGRPVTDVMDVVGLGVYDLQNTLVAAFQAPLNGGVATFDTLSVCAPGDGYRLEARLLQTFGSLTDTSEPFSISIGPASPLASTAMVPAGNVNRETVITVRSRDVCGNMVTAGDDDVAVIVTGSNSFTPEVVHLAGTNTYEARYTPVSQGTDIINITLNGEPLTDSPFSSPIGSGVVPSKSTATVPDGTAGQETEIIVVAKDDDGDPVGVGGDDVAVSVTGANTVDLMAMDQVDGSYRAVYTPLNAGSDRIAITINGLEIKDSPYPSTVRPAVAAASQTTAVVPDGRAGTLTTAVVTLRDAFGNPVGDDQASAGVVISGTISTGPNTGATVTSTNNDDGTWNLTYTPTIAGTDEMTITLDPGGDSDAAEIGGSPYQTIVAPGQAAPSGTTASVPAGTAGQLTTIVVTLRDAFGNAVGTDTASQNANVVGAVMSGPNTGAMVTNTNNGDGTWDLTYTPTTGGGTDQIAITLDPDGSTGPEPATQIGGSPFSSVVSQPPPGQP